jgi:hypothetical protein
MNILIESLIVFFVQLVFIWSRTLNVRAVADKNIPRVLFTGAIIHIAWLIGIAIGATNMYKIMNDFKLEYLPVIIASLAGGLLGSWLGMKNKK